MPKLYGSVEVSTVIGVTGTIRSGGSGQIISFDANTFWAAAESSIDKNKAMSYLMVVTNRSGSKASIILYYTDSSSTILMSGTYTAYPTYGITVDLAYAGTDYVDLIPIYSISYQAKEIKKLYGSVNGQTKEITKLYGSVNGQAKLIYGSNVIDMPGYGTWNSQTFWVGVTDSTGFSSDNVSVELSGDETTWVTVAASDYSMDSGFVAITWDTMSRIIPSVNKIYVRVLDINANIRYTVATS